MQHIAEWLTKIGLERYAPAFVDNDIDMSVLRYLTDADLEKIGVSLGHRRKLLAAIAALDGSAPLATSGRNKDPTRGRAPPTDADHLPCGAASNLRSRRCRRAPLPHGDVLRSGRLDRRFPRSSMPRNGAISSAPISTPLPLRSRKWAVTSRKNSATG